MRYTRMRMIHRSSLMLAALGLLAGCQAIPPAATPPPAPPPRAPAPVPTPTPSPVAPELSWDVAPVAPGDWRYGTDASGTFARFDARSGAPLLTLSCVLRTRQIMLDRPGAQSDATTMTIRTSYGVLQWAASPPAEGLEILVATRPATDPGFDWIAFSRGRIAIELAGRARLVVPVGGEISRVIEDCRN